MLRGSRSPSSSSAMATGPRSRCLGLIAPRTATLLLALLGVVAHMQTFRHLEVLYDSFPQVPRPRVGPSGSRHEPGYSVQHSKHPHAQPAVSSYVALDSTSDRHHIANAIAAAFHGSQRLPASQTDSAKVADATAVSGLTTSEDLLAMVKPTRWFNLLPKRPWSEEKPTPEEAAIWRAQQAGQDEERKSWEAARRLTKVMRFYALLSAVASLFGVYGVLKSNLASTRIFVMSSFLDVLLFSFSVISMCIIITYPEIRAMLCEQISSGELHALLSYMRGANNNTAAPTLVDIDNSSGASSAAAALASPAAPSSSTTFLSYAAVGSLWKRAVASSDEASTAHLYWWDTLIDNMLENESCDDIFVSVLVPLGLVICLAYLALRIHFLIVIRNYYTTLLRGRMGYYLSPASPDNSAGSDRLDTVDEKGRKYSSSSSSSSTAVEPSASRSKSSRSATEKLMGEKMA